MTAQNRPRLRQPTVVKLGGELLEEASSLRRLARTLAELSSRESLVVVHGGGREIDMDLAKHEIPKRSIDGLRITDAETLDIVVGVLAGRVNTTLAQTPHWYQFAKIEPIAPLTEKSGISAMSVVRAA